MLLWVGGRYFEGLCLEILLEIYSAILKVHHLVRRSRACCGRLLGDEVREPVVGDLLGVPVVGAFVGLGVAAILLEILLATYLGVL